MLVCYDCPELRIIVLLVVVVVVAVVVVVSDASYILRADYCENLRILTVVGS